jgi:organic hydroperoxide reductase OsmC/OhrA
MSKEHVYKLTVEWTGNQGNGTSDYRSYDRSHTISAAGKPAILGTTDPAFRGDPSKYNPEDLLVASLSSCHMLWFLHLSAVNGVNVVEYTDNPVGIMELNDKGEGKLREVTLYPSIKVTEASMLDKIDDLHKKAHSLCFIANSVNFPVYQKSVNTVVSV